jgi:hypothetical protein
MHACLQVNKCLSIKGAEDTINKPFAFEISTHTESMFFIAQNEKVGALGGGVHRCASSHSRTFEAPACVSPCAWCMWPQQWQGAGECVECGLASILELERMC